MGIINVLDESVANLIAAGEVVERPASVIKELVENSIDANAKNITIEIKNGGISYMRVTDDGDGIEPDDVGVAFLRHATSKIREKDDLSKIGTLGFRGEALCSVAAVSNVVLTTKTKDAALATRVIVEGGVMEDVLNIGAAKGTTIEVKKLFFNTPARMKFLKKDSTEAGYIADVVEKFILSHPDVSFKLINSGKTILFSSGDSNPINAIYSVYGKDYSTNVIPVDYQGEQMSITGFIGKSNISRPNRAYESFYVNGRSIKSAIMTKALEEAYKNQLMGGKFPFAVLNLQVNTQSVDVNVHPHKTEVKFSDEKRVFDTVYWGVKNALYQKRDIVSATFETKKDRNPFLFKESDIKEADSQIEKKPEKKVIANPFFEEKKPTKAENNIYISEVLKPAVELGAEFSENKNEPENKKDVNITFEVQSLKDDTKEGLFAEILKEEEPKDKEPKEEEIFEPILEKKEETKEEVIEEITEETAEKVAPESEENEKKEKSFKICGCVFNTYIIVEKDDEMLLIDQHAAHERIKYEALKAELASRENASQQLLDGQMVELSAEEYDFAIQNRPVFEKLGFEFEEMGYKRIMINAVPMCLCDKNAADIFIGAVDAAKENRKQLLSEEYERFLYTVACKSAVKANAELLLAEMQALVCDVFNMDNINTCPHGRPIIISFSKKEIEKQFKRIL